MKHFTSETHGGVTAITIQNGLFDELPELDDVGPPTAEISAEFQKAIVETVAVVVDLRRAGEVNKRTLSVTFRLAKDMNANGIRGVLCGSANLKQIWDLCNGNTLCRMFEEMPEAQSALRSA